MDNQEPVISEKELKSVAEDLIGKESTMALATAAGNKAWVAPVYYVFYKSGFYFFSDPASRHIQESLECEQASGTIYPSVSSWHQIRGIQMSGVIQGAPPGLEAIQAVKAYIRKFPFTKEFFKQGEPLNLESFAKRFKVKLYRFVPSVIYYLDNGIRFGFRKEIVF